MRFLSRKTGIILTILVVIVLSGCATQLAPSYDKAILDGINTVNKEAMTLFASVSAGTKKETFQARADAYNKIVGSVDALSIQTRARPNPQTRVGDALNKLIEKKGLATSGNEAPSTVALEGLSKTITKMRDTDQQQGLNATVVQAFKGQTAIYMEQAITYESFLQQ